MVSFMCEVSWNSRSTLLFILAMGSWAMVIPPWDMVIPFEFAHLYNVDEKIDYAFDHGTRTPQIYIYMCVYCYMYLLYNWFIYWFTYYIQYASSTMAPKGMELHSEKTWISLANPSLTWPHMLSYAHIHIHIYIYMHLYIYMYVCMYVCMHAFRTPPIYVWRVLFPIRWAQGVRWSWLMCSLHWAPLTWAVPTRWHWCCGTLACCWWITCSWADIKMGT